MRLFHFGRGAAVKAMGYTLRDPFLVPVLPLRGSVALRDSPFSPRQKQGVKITLPSCPDPSPLWSSLSPLPPLPLFLLSPSHPSLQPLWPPCPSSNSPAKLWSQSVCIRCSLFTESRPAHFPQPHAPCLTSLRPPCKCPRLRGTFPDHPHL